MAEAQRIRFHAADRPFKTYTLFFILLCLVVTSNAQEWFEEDLRPLKIESEEVAPGFRASLITLSHGITLEVLREAGQFIGLGEIRIQGLTVQPRGRTLSLSYSNKQAIVYRRQSLLSVEVAKDGLGAGIHVQLEHRDGTIDGLTWHLKVVSERWRRGEAVGLEFRFEFKSRKHKIHIVTESSSWTLGDTVTGLLFIQQFDSYGQQSQAFVLHANTSIDPQSPLHLSETPESRQGNGDFMDFLSAGNVSLVRYVAAPALTFRKFYRYPANLPYMRAEEKYVTALRSHFMTPPVRVILYHAGGVNAWLSARDEVRNQLHKASGISVAKLVPTLNFGAVLARDSGQASEDAAAPVRFIQSTGARRIWVWSRWKTNYTEWDKLSEREKSAMGNLPLSHALWRLEWSEKVVDLPKFRRFVGLCDKAGIQVILWVPGGHISPVSPLLKEHPDWIVYRRDGTPYTYAYLDVAACSYPAGYGTYMTKSILDRQREVPFHGVFLDSFQIYGLNAINFGSDELSANFDSALEHIRALRKQGLVVEAETLTPFAVPASGGVWNPDQIDSVPFLAFRTQRHFGRPDPKLTAERIFKLLAFAAPPRIYHKQLMDDPELRRSVAAMNRAYLRQLDAMVDCTVLPKRAGVLWWDKSRQYATVFVFKNGPVKVERTVDEVTDISRGKPVAHKDNRFTGKAQTIYAVTCSDP